PAARKSGSCRKECRRRSPSREPCWAGLNRSKTWRGSWSSRKESEPVDEPNGRGTEAEESESPRRHRRVPARTRCSESVREGGDEVILRINAPARSKVELFYEAGRWLCLHEVENKPESPPPFAQSLRRLLDNARIQGIEQRGFDRIAVFHVERGGEPINLVFEVFGKGNIVVAKKDTIAAVLFPQSFKDRAVQLGEQYRFPEAGLAPLELGRSAFTSALRTP